MCAVLYAVYGGQLCQAVMLPAVTRRYKVILQRGQGVIGGLTPAA